jgi:hypothetical protein
MSEYTDQEFLNTLEAAGPQTLPTTARRLIRELFVRVQALEARSLGEKSALLLQIAEEMSDEVEALGAKPDKNELRDRTTAALTAIRRLAVALAEESD